MSDISTIPFRIYLLAVVKGPKLEEPVWETLRWKDGGGVQI